MSMQIAPMNTGVVPPWMVTPAPRNPGFVPPSQQSGYHTLPYEGPETGYDATPVESEPVFTILPYPINN